MTEDARLARNAERLVECCPPFGVRMRRVISDLEAQGFRPRIQAAWRSPALQLAAFQSGHSKVRWGFHNATTPDGHPDALAVDLIDDDYPVPVDDQRQWPVHYRQYLLWLAALTAPHQIETGLAWGLDPQERQAIALAMNTDPLSYTQAIGWDPSHCEPRDLTLAAARAGFRPWS